MPSTLGMRARARSAIGLAMLLACCACAFALDPSLDVSQYAHKAWRVRDGFTKGFIQAFAQTHDGYLWLGTEFGLVRFDGVRAVPWQPPTGQQLPSDNIRALLAARDDTLWIGTQTGLASWKNGKLTTYPELSEQGVGALLEDREGTIWVGSISIDAGGRLCAIRNGSELCRGEDGSLGFGVLDLFEDSKGNLWVAVANGVWRWKPGTPEFFSVPGESNGVRFGGEDESGLIIGGHTGLNHLKSGHIEPFTVAGLLQPAFVGRMLRDRDGALWIGTVTSGIIHVHQGKADGFSQSDTLTGNVTTGIMEDREGNVWVATVDGLDQFRTYTIPTISVKQGLSNSVALSVLAARDGSVWIATPTSLHKWERGTISAFGDPTVPQKTDQKLSRFQPTTMFQDSTGRLCVATNQEFGYLEHDRFVPLPALPSGYLHSIAEAPAGHLWLTYQNEGLFHLSDGKVVQQIPWAGLGHKDSVAVLVGDPSQNGLWLGFYRGGVAYFADGGIRRYYSSGTGLGQGRVNHLRFGPRGALWVGTEGGLSRIKDGKVATLTSRNGLPCDSVLWTMEDDDHAFWLLMPCGLVRVTKSELDAWVADPNKVLSTTLFDNSDGVRTRPFAAAYVPQVTKSPDGRIWFAAWDGVSVIDPHNLRVNKLPPPVHIEQVNADRKTFDASNGLRLPPNIRDLEVDYTGLSFVVPEKVRFRYKLEGLDRDWQDAGNRRQAFYTNLPPRNYRFRVMASNNSGVWNEAGALLDFSVAPAYYQTLWFRSLCVIAFLALLAALYRLRLRQVARQFNMRLEERVNERMRLARDLHDTLLQSFQGVLLKFDAATDLLPDSLEVAEARKMLETTTEQARKAIIEGREIVQGLRSSTVVTNELARAIRTVGEELAAVPSDGNRSDFHVSVEGASKDIVPVIRDEIYRVACEALRNAFKHANARRIEVELSYDPRRFRLRVSDNGRGIDPKILSEGGSSRHYGLPGMQERARLVKGKLSVRSGPDSGTEIELTIPGAVAYAKEQSSREISLERGA